MSFGEVIEVMARYDFRCKDCTNKAVNAIGEFYCLPTIENGTTPIIFHDRGTDKHDFFTCPEFTNESRTIAIYELARNEHVL